MKKFFNLSHILFILIILLELIPSKRGGSNTWYVLGLVIAVEVFNIVYTLIKKDEEKLITAGDVISIIYGVIFAWELLTAKLNLGNKSLYPSAGEVFALFITELPEFLKGFISSMELLLTGYFLAVVVAVPLALFIGWRKRLYNAIKPVTKVLGPIPPIVYIPYAIAILPTFKVSSMFIIFIGAFWPVFMNTLNGVFNVDRKLIDSAKSLNVKEGSMLFQVILPAAIPSILAGANIGLVLSFILLTSAEMIGATSGLGWYVKYFSDFGDYKRVIAGIIFIGVVVMALTAISDRVEKYLLRWKK